MYLCKVCNQEFYSTVDCKAHLEGQHAGAQPDSCVFVNYQCPVCAVLFAHKIDCLNHALRDHGVQAAECRQYLGTPRA
jgi:hypothetical protein